MPDLPFDIAAGADDSVLLADAVSYPPLTPTFSEPAGTFIQVMRSLLPSDSHYYIINGRLRWTTSSLPAGAVPMSASFGINVIGLANADSRSLTADYYTWNMTNADYSTTAPASPILSIPIASLVPGWNNIPITDVSGISLTGDTYMRLHITGGVPVGDNFVSFDSFEGTGPQARLTVTYALRSRIAPDAILSQTNLTGGVSLIQDDPDSPDANWLVAP